MVPSELLKHRHWSGSHVNIQPSGEELAASNSGESRNPVDLSPFGCIKHVVYLWDKLPVDM